MQKILSALLVAFLPVVAFAQAQVACDLDINTEAKPGYKTVFKNKLVFFANTSLEGVEMWTFDGTTPTIANPLKDFSTGYGNHDYMIEYKGFLYYGGNTKYNGRELMRWDGIGIPEIVADISPGKPNSSPRNFILHDGKVYFLATTITEGEELWMYDPIPDTAVRVTDISQNSGSDIRYITVYANKLYFSAANFNTSGQELYAYDPATKQASLVADIYSGASWSSYPKHLTTYNGKLYFAAGTASYGNELYEFDGTYPPVRVSDITTGEGSSLPDMPTGQLRSQYIIGYKNKIYFVANKGLSGHQLYCYDPTLPADTANPRFVFNINPPARQNPTNFFVFEDVLYFSGDDGVHGRELWMYDGTNDPKMVTDLCRGNCHGDPDEYAIYNGKLYFTARDSQMGRELFRLEFTAGVPSVFRALSVTAYPVPSSGIVNFNINASEPGKYSLVIADIQGRQVWFEKPQAYVSGNIILTADLSGLVSGTYLYGVYNHSGEMLAGGKLIKQ